MNALSPFWFWQIQTCWHHLPLPRLEAMCGEVVRLMDAHPNHWWQVELAPVRDALLTEINSRSREQRRREQNREEAA